MRSLTAILALATLATAAPFELNDPQGFKAEYEPVEYTLKPVNETDKEIRGFEENAAVQKRANKVFGDHPGSTSSYPEGTGTYISTADNDRFGVFGLGNHCWTEIWYVKTEIVPENWQRDDTTIDCASTSQCESHQIKGDSACVNWSLSANIDFGLTRDVMSKIVGYSFNVGGEWGSDWGDCNTSESDNVCVWADQKCHSVWRSDLTRVDHGYLRRRCGKGGNDHTEWTLDNDWRTPLKETRIGCAATCDMTSYPEAVPPPPSV